MPSKTKMRARLHASIALLEKNLDQVRKICRPDSAEDRERMEKGEETLAVARAALRLFDERWPFAAR